MCVRNTDSRDGGADRFATDLQGGGIDSFKMWLYCSDDLYSGHTFKWYVSNMKLRFLGSSLRPRVALACGTDTMDIGRGTTVENVHRVVEGCVCCGAQIEHLLCLIRP